MTENTENTGNEAYGCQGFAIDLLMTALTGGLWLIWVFVREMRKK